MSIKKDIYYLFGIGKKEVVKFKNIEDIDKCIEESVIQNDKYQVELTCVLYFNK